MLFQPTRLGVKERLVLFWSELFYTIWKIATGHHSKKMPSKEHSIIHFSKEEIRWKNWKLTQSWLVNYKWVTRPLLCPCHVSQHKLVIESNENGLNWAFQTHTHTRARKSLTKDYSLKCCTVYNCDLNYKWMLWNIVQAYNWSICHLESTLLPRSLNAVWQH